MKTIQLSATALGLAALLLTVAHADQATTKTAPAMTAPAKAADSDADSKTLPSQSSIAAKTTFSTVAASDSAVTKALDAKSLTDAKKQIGKMGSFQGTVIQVYSPKSHSVVALDFAAHYKDALTADIAPEDYAKFPDLTQLQGKHILVSGKLVAHDDQTQLAVTNPDQIKIIP